METGRYPILDKGYIELLEAFGDELTIVNAARASFDMDKKHLESSDIKLIKYLWDNKHTSPMRHCLFRFKIKAPEFVLRQLFRHHVGIEATSTYSTQMHGWSERSGRYKIVDEYHFPVEWRSQSTTAKQGSNGVIDANSQQVAKTIFNDTMKCIETAYDRLLSLGIAKEQARIILPLNQYNTVIWTCSLQALLLFIEQRTDAHAQMEIREYAEIFKNIVKARFPNLSEIIHI